MSDLQKPIVNLNGATRQELIKEHLDILNALHNARIIMQARRPHGRDYQTKPELYDLARNAFEERIAAIQVMEREFEAVAMKLFEDHKP